MKNKMEHYFAGYIPDWPFESGDKITIIYRVGDEPERYYRGVACKGEDGAVYVDNIVQINRFQFWLRNQSIVCRLFGRWL